MGVAERYGDEVSVYKMDPSGRKCPFLKSHGSNESKCTLCEDTLCEENDDCEPTQIVPCKRTINDYESRKIRRIERGDISCYFSRHEYCNCTKWSECNDNRNRYPTFSNPEESDPEEES